MAGFTSVVLVIIVIIIIAGLPLLLLLPWLLLFLLLLLRADFSTGISEERGGPLQLWTSEHWTTRLPSSGLPLTDMES